MRLNLSKEAAYADKTPYELWQQTEEIPVYSGLAIEDLTTLSLGSWRRKGAMGAFINMLGAGRSCDAYVCEIPARDQTRPEHYLFEEIIYVVKGRGATSVWNVEGRKQTFEWQEGSMFSPPLNTWRQHFNAQGVTHSTSSSVFRLGGIWSRLWKSRRQAAHKSITKTRTRKSIMLSFRSAKNAALKCA